MRLAEKEMTSSREHVGPIPPLTWLEKRCASFHAGQQPAEDSDRDEGTERSDDKRAQQATEVTGGWPTAGIRDASNDARPECHEGTNQKQNDVKRERKTVLPSRRPLAVPGIEECGRKNCRRAQCEKGNTDLGAKHARSALI